MSPAMPPAPGPAFIRGVESPLPHGECVLWQGTPDRMALARHVFHVRKVAVYFAGLAVLSAGFATQSAAPWKDFTTSLAWLGGSALAATAFAFVLAGLTARATTYAVTNRRVVMRTGIALPVVLNIPLRLIEAIDLRQRPGATGDVAIRLGEEVRVAYLVLWPHVRPWRLRHPEPMLRGLREVDDVGQILRDSLLADAASPPSSPHATESAPNVDYSARQSPTGHAA